MTHAPPATARAELAALLRLSLPITVAQLGIVSMSLVDTAAIGRVSVDALAAAGIGRSIGFAFVIIPLGVTEALEPLAAQAIGAREPGRAWQAFGTTLRAGLLLWPAAMLASFLTTLLLPSLGLGPAVVRGTQQYLLGMAPGFAAMLAYFAARALLQAHGKTLPALLGSLVANLVNFPICNLLVRGDDALRAVGLPAVGMPALGALGGGIAFSISCFVLLVFVWLAARTFRSHGGESAPVTMGEAFRLGMPIGLQMFAEVGVFSLAALLSGAFGADVASAHHIAIGLASFTFMGAIGVSGATAVLVGHAVGAGRSPRRIGLLGIATGGAFMLLGAVAFSAAPELLVRAFTSDPRVIAVGVDLVRIAALFQIFDGVQSVAAGALRGAGDVRFPFGANVAAHWLVGFPLCMLFGFVLRGGAQGLWWGLTAGLVAVSVLLTGRFVVLTRSAIARV